MKNSLALIALVALFAGSVACTSAPKQEEAQPELAAAEETVVDTASTEPAVQPAQETTSSTSSDLSLGSGSSGRGH